MTIGSGRGFLESDTCRGQAQGLLERWLDPAPIAVVEEGAHGDVTTAEVQGVRFAGVPRVTTWRPIRATAANVVQLTRDVVTQGGQVKIITCVGSGREAGVVDTTIGVAVAVAYCT